MTKNKFTLIDLFAGAGGMSLGFEMTGEFKILGAIDNWEPAVNTFRLNHPDIPDDRIMCADVSDYFPVGDQERKYKIPEWIKTNSVDVVIGGPPCQGMSLAGKRISDDPRNYLFKSFIKAVAYIKPKIFIMENVPGLLSTAHGEINKAILSAFSDIGYNHFDKHIPQILNAECYGVPQIRRRLFYVGFRDDLDDEFLGWPPKAIHGEFSRKKRESNTIDLFTNDTVENYLPKPISVKEAISDLPPLKSGEGSDVMEYSTPENQLTEFQKLCRKSSVKHKIDKNIIFNHEAPNHTSKLLGMIVKASPGTSVDPKYTDSKKWSPNWPGYTVKALGAGGGSTNRRAFHYDPNQPRGSTVRENARIQSFPDWYRFSGAKTHQMTQVGNAVPPLLAKCIAKVVAKKLTKNGR
jgi:DNA (cytosine-5)-methyltransferase 1